MTSLPNPFEQGGELNDSDYRLIQLYQREGMPLDRLPYTAEFERIFAGMQQASDSRDRAAIYQRLLYIRKSGRLPRFDLGKTG